MFPTVDPTPILTLLPALIGAIAVTGLRIRGLITPKQELALSMLSSAIWSVVGMVAGINIVATVLLVTCYEGLGSVAATLLIPQKEETEHEYKEGITIIVTISGTVEDRS